MQGIIHMRTWPLPRPLRSDFDQKPNQVACSRSSRSSSSDYAICKHTFARITGNDPVVTQIENVPSTNDRNPAVDGGTYRRAFGLPPRSDSLCFGLGEFWRERHWSLRLRSHVRDTVC